MELTTEHILMACAGGTQPKLYHAPTGEIYSFADLPHFETFRHGWKIVLRDLSTITAKEVAEMANELNLAHNPDSNWLTNGLGYWYEDNGILGFRIEKGGVLFFDMDDGAECAQALPHLASKGFNVWGWKDFVISPEEIKG